MHFHVFRDHDSAVCLTALRPFLRHQDADDEAIRIQDLAPEDRVWISPCHNGACVGAGSPRDDHAPLCRS